MLNYHVAQGRAVSASPLLFAVTVCSVGAWGGFSWAFLVDWLSTHSSPSPALVTLLTLLTVGITLLLSIKRRIYITAEHVAVVEDRLFSILIHHRECELPSASSLEVRLFGDIWYLFVVNVGPRPNDSLLITYARADAMLAMDLVTLFEHADLPNPEVITC